jgi:ABC-2 type transport system permease protein
MIKKRRVFAVLKKEIYHILRDPFTLMMALVMPVVMVLMFGSSIEFNVQNVPTICFDQSHSQSSRAFLRLLGSSKYFQLKYVDSISEGYRKMEKEEGRALIVIPPTFEHDLFCNNSGKIQLLLDGTDNTAVGAISGYISTVQAIANKIICGIQNPPAPVKLVSRFIFNPELSSKWFIIPGLSAVIMAILSLLLTALTISKEWENGSMELLLSTPVRPFEIVFGKILPYAILGIFSVFIVYIVARTIYNLPFVGSYLIFGLGTLLFLFAYLGLGLFISTVVRNQQAAVQIAMMLGMMPSMLLSGFIFALEHMPVGFKYIASIFPARWYMQIARDQFLKGSNFNELWIPFTALFISVFVAIELCILKFKRTLEK